MAKFDRNEIGMVADRVLEDEETSKMVTRMEAEADAELAGTITLRWGRQHIEVVKRAAETIGVPYQTYLKQVVFKQALEDIARAEAVLGTGQPAKRSSKPASSRASSQP